MDGISRSTVDKWIARYQIRGPSGLEDASRAPRYHPNQTATGLREAIVALKLPHQSWGAKKVLDRLRREQPHRPWLADPTSGASPPYSTSHDTVSRVFRPQSSLKCRFQRGLSLG